MASEMRFAKVKKMLESKGYVHDRTSGSHHIFVKANCEPVVIPVHNGKVKPVYVPKVENIHVEE